LAFWPPPRGKFTHIECNPPGLALVFLQTPRVLKGDMASEEAEVMADVKAMCM
jgi:hypothetical protein